MDLFVGPSWVVLVGMQLQEKILAWFKSGNWGDIVAEKRSVLTSMQQVLQSCYALLDSTQVPVNSIIKLLQHILRCEMTWYDVMLHCCKHVTELCLLYMSSASCSTYYSPAARYGSACTYCLLLARAALVALYAVGDAPHSHQYY